MPSSRRLPRRLGGTEAFLLACKKKTKYERPRRVHLTHVEVQQLKGVPGLPDDPLGHSHEVQQGRVVKQQVRPDALGLVGLDGEGDQVDDKSVYSRQSVETVGLVKVVMEAAALALASAEEVLAEHGAGFDGGEGGDLLA
jgi:hypothetical protein